MTDPDLVALDPKARRCWPWLPAVTRAGRVMIGPCGETVRVDDFGHLDLVQLGNRPHAGIASDPVMAGRPRRYP